MPYASIIVNVLQSEQEEEDALVKDEDATKHEIVQEIFLKSCIRETLNISTDADRSTNNIFLEGV